MKPLNDNEESVIAIIATNQRATFKGIGRRVGMKYRGVQDLVARLVLDGYLLRAGHGRGQQLHLTDKGKQFVGNVPVLNVPKRKPRDVAIRHVEPDYDTMTYPELVQALIGLEELWSKTKAEGYPCSIWRCVCEPKLRLVETVFRRWPAARAVPLWREVEARAIEMRDFYFALSCASMAKERDYVAKLADVILDAPAEQLAEFHARLNGVPTALVEPAHVTMISPAS